MTNEQILTDFMRQYYSDERLAMLLAHCEDGKFAFLSCCCLIGIPTADHALRGESSYGTEPHYIAAKSLHERNRWGCIPAESLMADDFGSDEERRAFLIPLIRAEFERRSSATISDTNRSSLQSEADQLVISALPQESR